jgi:hypothetical protein
MVSVPTDSAEVVRVAVVTAFAPVPVVVNVAVPSVVTPSENVTVPAAGVEAPATVGTVKVRTTGEPKVEVVGLAVRVSPAPEAAATVAEVVDEIVLKLPLAGAVAVIVSVPTGKAVVVVVAMQEVAVPVAGSEVKDAVPSVVPPLANVTVAVGQRPLTGAIVSVSVTGEPKVAPDEGEAVSEPDALAGLTVSVVVADPDA